jgi:hypothetical protein
VEKTEFIVTDHYISLTEEERKRKVLNIIINYSNAKTKAEEIETKYPSTKSEPR